MLLPGESRIFTNEVGRRVSSATSDFRQSLLEFTHIIGLVRASYQCSQ